ncbi:beta-lactamase/transpeptidase-like protein [Apiospora rasikravindrae]|uniref:Beta-lactamase/transpeptidase-like protein n=1 Tax=Apiospora rasikravindrae TaxID=990691 RepID=A0ABR1TE87_9PEZI
MRVPSGCAAALLLCPGALASQKVLAGGHSHSHNPLDQAFERFALETLDEFHVPGLAIAIVDGENTWAAGYGNATLPGTPVTPSTLFYGGSTTKAFTAAAFAQLIDSGAHPDLTWRAPLASLIREDFVLAPEYAWAQEHLTLEDALSHRTGFPRHDKSLSTQYGPDGHKATMRDLAQSLRYLPMVHEPRVEFRYCNLMFMVASHVLQTLTGRWLGTTLREGIWRPLGMNATYFSLEDAQAAPEHLAMGYWWDYSSNRSSKNDGGFGEVPFAGLDEASGAGAVVSTVLDYAKWIRCLANEEEPLSKAAHAAIKTPRMTPVGTGKGWDGPGSYALGWMVNPYKGHTVYNHGGGMEGYGAEVFFLPDLGYGVVTLANTAVTSNMAGKTLAWKLINDKLGVAEEDRYEWAAAGKKSIQDILSSYDSAVDRLYPERTEQPLPPTLPLQKYAGTYYHPAYQNLTVEVDEGTPLGSRQSSEPQLKATHPNAVWDNSYEFEHVSGEFWVIFMDMKKSPNWLSGQVAKAEFRLGPDGWPDKLVVEYMEDGTEGVITYVRVE